MPVYSVGRPSGRAVGQLEPELGGQFRFEFEFGFQLELELELDLGPIEQALVMVAVVLTLQVGSFCWAPL